MSEERKPATVYLGDGVYCEDEGFQVKLWTTREGGVIHEIYLGPYELQAIVNFAQKIWYNKEDKT